MAGAKPPPYEPYRRYALIPTSLTKQLQAAAFQPTVAAVELDMSSLVQDTEGEEVRVIATREDLDGPGFFLHHMEPRKERMWKLKAGLVEDEDFIYISEEGWNKIATG
jgi:ubiquitin carboxyl-terminal hydrolase 4/11/15